MSELEKKYLDEAFNSNWIAPQGPSLEKFEKDMANYLAVEKTVATSSGTAALHLALRVLEIQRGDRVLCPSLTFAASANVIMYEGGEPIFIDSNPETWVIDLNSLESAMKKYRPKALIAVDIYGNSCDYDSILALSKKYNVKVVEDAAESLGSKYKKRRCGSFGDIGILSFNGNKIITTSSGGLLVSRNNKYVEKAKFLSNQARERVLHYEHKELGFNYRLSNILAAIGCGQLLRINEFVKNRRNIYKNYFSSLSMIEGIRFMKESKESFINRWLTTFTIDKNKINISRDQVIEALEKHNIESRPVWKPMHSQPFYKGFKYVSCNKEDVSLSLFNQGICLPSGSNLKLDDQLKIIGIIKSLIQN